MCTIDSSFIWHGSIFIWLGFALLFSLSYATAFRLSEEWNLSCISCEIPLNPLIVVPLSLFWKPIWIILPALCYTFTQILNSCANNNGRISWDIRAIWIVWLNTQCWIERICFIFAFINILTNIVWHFL